MENRKALKYFRGSMWKIDLTGYPMEQGVQAGDRYAIVMSSDRGNMSNNSVMVHLTTANTEKSHISINVPFVSSMGVESLVLCNQMLTVNTSRLTLFSGMLDAQVMRDVEKAHCEAVGIKETKVDTKPIEDIIDKIVINYGNNKLRCKEPDITQDAVLKIAEKLEEIFKDVVIPLSKAKSEAPVLTSFCASGEQSKSNAEVTIPKEPTAVIPTPAPEIEADIFHPQPIESGRAQGTKAEKVKKAKKADKADTAKRKNKPQGYWTPELMREFITDRDVLPMDKMTEKWGVGSIKTVYQMVYKFRQALKV